MQRLARIFFRNYFILSSQDCLASASPVFLLSLPSRMEATCKDNGYLFENDSCVHRGESINWRQHRGISSRGVCLFATDSCTRKRTSIDATITRDISEDIESTPNAPLAKRSTTCSDTKQGVMEEASDIKMNSASNLISSRRETRRLKIDKDLAKRLFEDQNLESLDCKLLDLTGNCLLGIGGSRLSWGILNRKRQTSWKPVPRFYASKHDEEGVKTAVESYIANMDEGLQKKTRNMMGKLRNMYSGGISEETVGGLTCPENPYVCCNALVDFKYPLISAPASAPFISQQTAALPRVMARRKSSHALKQKSHGVRNHTMNLAVAPSQPSMQRVEETGGQKYWTLMQLFNRNRLVGIQPVSNNLLKTWGLGELIGQRSDAQEAVYAKILRVPVHFSVQEILDRKGRNSIKYLGRHHDVGLIAIGHRSELLGVLQPKPIAEKRTSSVQNGVDATADVIPANFMIGCNMGLPTVASHYFKGVSQCPLDCQVNHKKPIENWMGQRRRYTKYPFGSTGDNRYCISKNHGETIRFEGNNQHKNGGERAMHVLPRNPNTPSYARCESQTLNRPTDVPGKPFLENRNPDGYATQLNKGDEGINIFDMDCMPALAIVEFGGRQNNSNDNTEMESDTTTSENSTGNVDNSHSNIGPAKNSSHETNKPPLNGGGGTAFSASRECPYHPFGFATPHAHWNSAGTPHRCPIVCFPSKRSHGHYDQGMVRLPRPCPYAYPPQPQPDKLGQPSLAPPYVAQPAEAPTRSSFGPLSPSTYSPPTSESAQTYNFPLETGYSTNAEAESYQTVETVGGSHEYYSQKYSPDSSTITSSNLCRLPYCGSFATTPECQCQCPQSSIAGDESSSNIQYCPWPKGYSCPKFEGESALASQGMGLPIAPESVFSQSAVGSTSTSSTGPYYSCSWPCTESGPQTSNTLTEWSPYPFQAGSQSDSVTPSYYTANESPSYQSSYGSYQYATPSFHSTPSTFPSSQHSSSISHFTPENDFDSTYTYMPSSEYGTTYYSPTFSSEHDHYSGASYYSSDDSGPTSTYYPSSASWMRPTGRTLSSGVSSHHPSEYYTTDAYATTMPSQRTPYDAPSTGPHEMLSSRHTPSALPGTTTGSFSHGGVHPPHTYHSTAPYSYRSPQHGSPQQSSTSSQGGMMSRIMQHHPVSTTMTQPGISASSSCMPCIPCPYCCPNQHPYTDQNSGSDYLAGTTVMPAAENSAEGLNREVKAESPEEGTIQHTDNEESSQASVDAKKTSGKDSPIPKTGDCSLSQNSTPNTLARNKATSKRVNPDESLSCVHSLNTNDCSIPPSTRSLDGLLRKEDSHDRNGCDSVSCSGSKLPEEYQPVARVPRKWTDIVYPFQSIRSVESELHKSDGQHLPEIDYLEPGLSKILEDLGITESNKAAYGGEWIGSGDVVEATDPAMSAKIACVTLPTTEEVEHCIQVAKDASSVWMSLQAPCRSVVLHEIAHRVLERMDSLAKLLSWEVGKVSMDAMCEVRGVVHMFEYAAGLASILSGNVFESERPDHIILERFHPMGVTGILSAFNTAYSTFGKSASLSLAVGNSVIFKPSPTAILSSVALMKIVGDTIKSFGLPPVVTCIQGGHDVGRVMAEDKRIDVVAFSGTAVNGHDVGMRVQNRFGKSLLNLSGNNSMIVSHDANFELALHAATLGVVDFAGQKKQKISHIIVHRHLYSQFVEELGKMLLKVTKFCGHPLDPRSIFGPLHSKDMTNHYLSTVQKIREAGGKIEVGGGQIEGNYVAPAIVTNLRPDCDLAADPIIGPLALIFPASDIEEAIEINNSFSNRMNSSVFTKNVIDVYRDLHQLVHVINRLLP